jgi:hypothetical protein
MRTAGIITLPGYFNYGQRLQNYAVTQLLKKCGYAPESIYFDKMPKAANKKLKAFTDEHTVSRVITSNQQLNEYDKIIVGSDQVFNYRFKSFKKMNLFNRLAKIESSKLIAFCASMGFEKLPDGLSKAYAEHLLKYKAISVREQSAANIIEDITGIRPTVLLDPVFLISDWGKMASNKFKTIGGYEFSYYVMGKECIMLIDGKEHRDIMNLSVPDFLSAIKYSKSVFTNSYHGFCFSIIFDRKAYLIENRPGISTRFETILQVFNAEQTTETTWRVEKGQDRNIIQDGQKKARQFLEDALSDT